MPNNKKETTEPLDHIKAMKNVTAFLVEYRKWYDKNKGGGFGTQDGGSNPGGPTPPPPPPNP
jgi:hypothetical protein